MERITVNMSPTAMLETCHASQFDVGVQKRFDLVDGSSAYTLTGAETITLKIRTPDGTLVESNVPNTSDSYVIWTSGAGELDAFGICLCSIHITNGSDELGSGNFIMEVEADPYNGKNLRIVTVGPADICTFDTTLPEPYHSVTVNVEATGGNGTPDNPIPINGYTEANITRCGVNLWDESIKRGYIYNGNYYSSDSYWCNDGNIPVKPNTTYTFSGITSGGQICFYDSSNTYMNDNTGTADNKTFTTPSGCYYISVYNPIATEGNNKQLELGSSPTTYHAYNGNTYTIAFGQTVYGGVLDVTSGKLTVTYGYEELGSLAWYASVWNGENAFFCSSNINAKTPADYDTLPNALSDIYSVVTRNQAYSQTTVNYQLAIGGDGKPIIRNLDYSDVATFKPAMLGHYLAYELATPFDIDLTPVQIRALVGENNVFADCGETTVEYLAEE